jgi:hypothetical protein
MRDDDDDEYEDRPRRRSRPRDERDDERDDYEDDDVRYLKPHRGGLILALGLIGFMVCGIIGIAGWIMGRNDLREMESGRMDREGKGLTQAGSIIGLVSFILHLVIGIIYVALFIVFVAAVPR